jgi:hypothetical protein
VSRSIALSSFYSLVFVAGSREAFSASGKAVTDVTWDAVAELNAKHAHEHAEVTKATAPRTPPSAQS